MTLLHGGPYEDDTSISLFGRVIPQRLRDRSPSPGIPSHPNRVGITSLPVELLMWIFDLHFKQFVMRRKLPSLEHYRYHVGLDSDECDCDEGGFVVDDHFPSRNTLFPYAQAQVCMQWRQILSAQPKFWTRVIVSRVAGIHTPPDVLEKYLEWSRDLPIDVFIGNIGYDGYENEREVIQHYTTILSHHIHRCRVIDYDVRFATSLPCLLKDFDIIPENLLHLQLKSQETHDPSDSWIPTAEDLDKLNGRKYELDEHQVIYDERPSHLRFNKLILDGRNFILACRNCPSLFTCNELEVYNYRRSIDRHPEVDKLGFLLAEGIREIQAFNNSQLVKIIFQNIEFALPSDEDEPIALQDIVFELHLINVDFLLIEQSSHFRYDGVPLSIERCSFPSIYNPLPVEQLCLTDIKEDDLALLLRRWIGNVLQIQRCPGFNDNVLRDMARFQRTETLPVPTSLSLRIMQCNNFSFEALKRMAMARDDVTSILVFEARDFISASDEDSMAFLADFVYRAGSSAYRRYSERVAGYTIDEESSQTRISGIADAWGGIVALNHMYSDEDDDETSEATESPLLINIPTQPMPQDLTKLCSNNQSTANNDDETSLTPQFSTHLRLGALNLQDEDDLPDEELDQWLNVSENESW